MRDKETQATPKLLLRVPEAAEALALSRAKVYQMLASGQLKSVKIGAATRIPIGALQRLVAQLCGEEGEPLD